MFNPHYKRHWFYALAAIVLLLQSFAVWHDAEHAFHADDAQCERLNAINHVPVADISPDIIVTPRHIIVASNHAHYVFALPTNTRSHHAIRGPPSFS
ncbi:hypothetical protein [Methylophaga thiooxydans]|uniref:hypothetical protein n=1 Tax=Methylophaga thiooxydans TaxID=392484 RepID=UPI000316B183|nr:hypothetical protein [Methylophaga thiooxydans]